MSVFNANHAMNLFCIPYGGEGASIYWSFKNKLTTDLSIIPVQLPGREERLNDRMPTSMGALCPLLLADITPYLHAPIYIFGHCLGGLIAYELAILIHQEYDISVEHLFISACPSPRGFSIENKLHQLSPQAFIAASHQLMLRESDAQIDPQVDEAELNKLVFKTLYNDFLLYEEYHRENLVKLNAPITTFRGRADGYVSEPCVHRWEALTSAGFQYHEMPGKHFYLKDAYAGVFKIIEDEITQRKQTG
jgi:surfactin synthase thioesterase subunit